jgi:hypothetical protein
MHPPLRAARCASARVQAAAYVVDAVIYLMSWQGNACVTVVWLSARQPRRCLPLSPTPHLLV